MKKIFLITIVSLCCINSYAQDKWFSTVEMEFVVPSKIDYHYRFMNSVTHINLDSKVGAGLHYSMNYKIFKKLSVVG
ncbi:hypothetical protein KO493_06685 [Tamlana agarivorans]|uniref:Uncharacterized protein n=1 Tax=Pseudotamlana agarivorans TaxID=481183 RepID=A0ACC5U7S0_9FLAO|nr:hypothetical protein [Tamlana agarivorans]MBU2950377.1 hypothetical protein [Tamlana agarivorans]